MNRSSGILLPLSSLPSPYGIGDLGPSAYAVTDFLHNSGQTYWQILPINPTDGINSHSPYSCFSAFAGNPLLISPQLMVSAGLLSPAEARVKSAFDEGFVDYAKVATFKEHLFDLAYARFQKSKDKKDFERFKDEHKHWLKDFALFMVMKALFSGRCWQEWPKPLRTRQAKALQVFARQHREALERVELIQYIFFRQWEQLRQYAKSQGVALIGDIPIYVNYDSVEVWCHPRFFKLDQEGAAKFISGCPPDYFSRTGQRWGNPVYDWAQLKKAKYSWWVQRIAHNLQLFDYLRIDHFRGFVSFWQIPAHEKLAVFGRWVKGPGEDFFKVLHKQFNHLPLVAEDLGEITPDVVALMKKFNIPGMRVLLFGFGGDLKTNPHVPHNYELNSVAYSGTHDNNTIQGWFRKEAKSYEKANMAQVLGGKVKPSGLHWAMIELLLRSKAQTVIVPMQDFLGLGSEARMNTPATKVNNWKWRLAPHVLTPALSRKILKLAQVTQRTAYAKKG